MKRKLKLFFVPIWFSIFWVLVINFDFFGNNTLTNRNIDSSENFVENHDEIFDHSRDNDFKNFDDIEVPENFDKSFLLEVIYSYDFRKFLAFVKKFNFINFGEDYRNFLKEDIEQVFNFYRLIYTVFKEKLKIDNDLGASLFKLHSLAEDELNFKIKNCFENCNYKLVKHLKQGNNGIIFLYENLKYQKEKGLPKLYAVKLITLNHQFSYHLEKALYKFNILKKFSQSSEYFVKYYDYFKIKDMMFIIMEYVPDSIDLNNFFDKSHNENKLKLTISEQANIGYQIGYAIPILIKHCYNTQCYLDYYNCNNILYNKNTGRIKFIDFEDNFFNEQMHCEKGILCCIELFNNFYGRCLKKEYPDSAYVKRLDEENKKIMSKKNYSLENDIKDDEFLEILSKLKGEFYE